MNKKISIINLDNYGLTYAQFLKLKKKVKVEVRLTYPEYEKFFVYKPEDRRKKIDDILLREYDRLVKILPHKNFKKNTVKRVPRSIEIEINTSDVKLFENKKFVKNVWIQHIHGLQKKKQKKTEKKKLWYAVKAIFNIQFEGFTGGMNMYEESIILFNAYNYQDARKIAEKKLVNYHGKPYLNTDQVMVNWKFEKIIDICETDVYNNKLDTDGTEVYFSWKRRKMKPEYEWHPIKKYKKA